MNYANDRVRANEGENGNFVGSYSPSDDQKTSGAAGGARDDQVCFEFPSSTSYKSRFSFPWNGILALASRC